MADKKLIRLDWLKHFCKMKGLVEDGAPSPTLLAKAIGRSVAYASDLLRGTKSFGEDSARHIEECLKLPEWALDGGAGWPFPQIDRSVFDSLDEWQRIEIQGVVRQHIAGFVNNSLPNPLESGAPTGTPNTETDVLLSGKHLKTIVIRKEPEDERGKVISITKKASPSSRAKRRRDPSGPGSA